MDVVALNDHIAKVDACARLEAPVGRQADVALGLAP
jgi:hypothetical protein